MKHGRPGFVLSALTRPGDEQAVATAMLRETSTLGVRIARLDRIELERESRTVDVGGEPVRVKVGRLDGQVVNLAPEHADCERAARRSGAPVKTVWAQALAAAQRRTRDRAARRARGGVGAPRSAVVAFSGGVDSSLVAAVAARALGARALAVTAVSPAVAAGELDGARRVAAAVGIAHETIATDELARDGYRAQRPRPLLLLQDRALRRARRARRRRGYRALLSGANADDAGDWRPGLRAAAEHGVRHPLLEAGAGKAAVRALARGSGCRAPTSRPRPAWRRASPTGPRSTPRRSPASTAPSGPCARSASPCCASATTASSGGSRSPPRTSTGRSRASRRSPPPSAPPATPTRSSTASRSAPAASTRSCGSAA